MNRTANRVFAGAAMSALAIALSACGQSAAPEGSENVQAAQVPAAEEARQATESAAPAKIALRRAYVGSNLAEGNKLNEAKTDFVTGEQVYVGVLLAAKPAPGQQATVFVEAFDGSGNSVGTGRTDAVDADRVVLPLVPTAATLAPGTYVVAIKLNDVPSWEVKFSVK